MHPEEHGTSLRQTERRQLLGHLADLGSPEPERRAKAALKATELLRRKGLSWHSLLPPIRHDAPHTADPQSDWRDQAVALLNHPELTAAERTFIRKVIGWRAPGTDGSARLQEIAERVGAQAFTA